MEILYTFSKEEEEHMWEKDGRNYLTGTELQELIEYLRKKAEWLESNKE